MTFAAGSEKLEITLFFIFGKIRFNLLGKRPQLITQYVNSTKGNTTEKTIEKNLCRPS